jgi:hypothetical protein
MDLTALAVDLFKTLAFGIPAVAVAYVVVSWAVVLVRRMRPR